MRATIRAIMTWVPILTGLGFGIGFLGITWIEYNNVLLSTTLAGLFLFANIVLINFLDSKDINSIDGLLYPIVNKPFIAKENSVKLAIFVAALLLPLVFIIFETITQVDFAPLFLLIPLYLIFLGVGRMIGLFTT